MHLIDRLKSEIAEALEGAIGADAEGLEVQGLFEYPEDAANGDLAFPCFQLAKKLKKGPPQIAADLASRLKLSEVFAKVEAKGPYLNFFLEGAKLLDSAVAAAEEAGESYGRSQADAPEKVMIEYVSPNNNKPLHLGHVRNGLIGETVSNLLESQGHKVIRALLLNDRGLAIAKAMVAYAKWGEGKTPEMRGTKGDHFVAEYYVMYDKKSKEGEAGLEEEAHEVIRKWEDGDAATRKLWKTLNDWCEAGQHETYKKFGFHFDVEYKESDIYKEGKDIIAQGIEKGVFVKNETGATIAKLEAHGLPDKVVLRADGTSLYVTQDLALAKRKFEEHHLDAAIIATANEQNLIFKQLFLIIKLLGFPWADKLSHLSYGYVSLPEGRMKSREGTVVDADDLLATLEADAAIEIKQRHITITDDELVRRAKSVALAAVKFYFLEIDIVSDITFDPKASLSFNGKTGPYLQYMHARIRSILRKSDEPHETAYEGRNPAPEEKALAVLVAKWPETVREAARAKRPSLVAAHLYDTAKSFASFYENAQVLSASAEDRAARLGLVTAVAAVIKNGLKILGIEAPEEM